MKTYRRFKPVLLILFVIVCSINRCTCDDDDNLEVPTELNIAGTWILKSAEFQDDDVDLDGDGPMEPIKDIKFMLLDWLDVYANCSSMDEVPLHFSEDLAQELTSAETTKKFLIYVVCPAGMGITSPIAAYYFDIYRANAFYIEVDELNDPGNFIDWNGSMHVFITDDLIIGGTRQLHGKSSIIPSGTSHYRHFDFVLEEYKGATDF